MTDSNGSGTENSFPGTDSAPANPPGSGGDDYADTNERDIRAKQAEDPSGSAATDDADIEEDDVKVLPGTGGPDDVGDIEVDPADLNMDGHP
jgi:hypothetical protein